MDYRSNIFWILSSWWTTHAVKAAIPITVIPSPNLLWRSMKTADLISKWQLKRLRTGTKSSLCSAMAERLTTNIIRANTDHRKSSLLETVVNKRTVRISHLIIKLQRMERSLAGSSNKEKVMMARIRQVAKNERPSIVTGKSWKRWDGLSRRLKRNKLEKLKSEKKKLDLGWEREETLFERCLQAAEKN